MGFVGHIARSARFSNTAFAATMIEERLINSADHSGRSSIPNEGYSAPAATGIASTFDAKRLMIQPRSTIRSLNPRDCRAAGVYLKKSGVLHAAEAPRKERRR